MGSWAIVCSLITATRCRSSVRFQDTIIAYSILTEESDTLGAPVSASMVVVETASISPTVNCPLTVTVSCGSQPHFSPVSGGVGMVISAFLLKAAIVENFLWFALGRGPRDFV